MNKHLQVNWCQPHPSQKFPNSYYHRFYEQCNFQFKQWMQMMMRLQEHRKQRFLIIFFNNGHLMFMTSKKKKNLKLLNLKSNIKVNKL
jgi:hypothetical protein